MDITKLYFSLDGRISRKTYWLFCGLPLIFSGLYVGLSHVYFSPSEELLLILIFLWPSLAVHVKRWHYQDKSGWWQLFAAIPLLGSLIVMVMCGCIKGTYGKNRFGNDPLQT